MAQNYTRQSSFADGDTITASLFNNEYNQLVNAFAYSSTDVSATGHRHDGSIGQGGNIAQIGDLDFNNKIVVDGTNNRWGFFVEVAGASVEQIRLQDGVIIPVTTNDIDLGSASLQFKDAYFDGTVNADSLVLSSGATVTAILDEDAMTSNSATALATQQSIKAYVDSQVTAQDLDFQGDSGGALSIDLDSETLTIAGGTGIDTAGATNTLTVSIDNTVTTLTGTQVLTNKTIDADNNTVSNLEVDNLKTGVLDTDISAVAVTHTTLPSALAVKTYVDAQVTAQDLDIFGDTGTDAIDLDSETLTFTGGTGITSVVTAGTVTHNIDSTVATLTDTQTLTNKTLTSPDINGGTIDGAIIGATTAAAGSFTTVAASGNITVGGTVDGRDVAADGTKLDGIESGATADQTAAEIRALVEAATDSNVFTDADHTKLNGIEALADVTDTANVTAAGALMDSELTNITAVKALNQGVATTDSPSFAGLTATTADINGGTIDGTVIGATTPAAGSFTTISASGEIAANGGIAFGDNDKATFGASDDLQIYHDGSHSYITDVGTGDLNVLANKFLVKSASGGSTLIQADPTATNVQLFFGNAAKLATTATGIDVTGTVTADGLTVSNSSLQVKLEEVDGTYNPRLITYFDSSGTHLQHTWSSGADSLFVELGGAEGAGVKAMRIQNGDISFYEDTGTTPKFFWDASAESLGIGTTTPSSYAFNDPAKLVVANTSGNSTLTIASGTSSIGYLAFADGTSGTSRYSGSLQYNHSTNALSMHTTDGSERMRIDSSGNVGIACTPDTALNAFGYKVLEVAGANTTKSGALLLSNSSGTDFGQIYADNSDGWKFVNGQATKSTIFYGGSGAAERMRIDSSGNLLVGVTSISDTTSRTYGNAFSGSGAVGNWTSWGSGSHTHATFRNGTGIVGTITTNGTTTAYNITSDERLKENIVDTTHTVDINDIKVRQYDWKSNGEHQRYGFIAQELEAVYPEAVHTPEDPELMKSVDYSKLVPLLVKEIQDLKAEVAALKGA